VLRCHVTVLLCQVTVAVSGDSVAHRRNIATFSRLSKERNSISKNVCYFERERNINLQNAVAFVSIQ
jgi:hypothetical protein